MLKRIFFMVLVLSFIVPLQAQTNPTWAAWLFNIVDGSVTQVNNRGEVVGAFGLPLPQAFNAYGADILISPSGRYAVYTATDTTVDRPNTQMFVYDSEAQSVTFTYDMTDVEVTSFELAPRQTAFDERHSQIAVGLLRESGWEVIVIDYSVGIVRAALTPDKAEIVENDRIVPVVQLYDGETVFFTTVYWGTEGLDRYPAFQWRIGSGQVRENGVFTSIVAAYLPTNGEIAHPARNEDFELPPVSEGPNLRANVIEVFSAPDSEATTIYHDDVAVIHNVYYIHNGERLLAKTYNHGTDEYRLKVINRDGEMVGELLGSLEQIKGTPDGFIGLFESQGGVSLAFVDTSSGELNPVTVWTAEGLDLQEVKLAHVQSDVETPTALPEWTTIASDE